MKLIFEIIFSFVLFGILSTSIAVIIRVCFDISFLTSLVIGCGTVIVGCFVLYWAIIWYGDRHWS